jgi:hypothetical protein
LDGHGAKRPPRHPPDVPKIGDAGSTNPPDTLNLLPDCLNRFTWRTDDGIV